MYPIAVTLLLGLALVKLVDLLDELVPGVDRFRSAVTVAIAVIGAYAIDWSVFDGFQVTPRESWLGTAVTGLVVAGAATVWQAVLGWLGSPEGHGTPARSTRDRLVGRAA